MNNITYAVSVDVNNPIIPYNVYVANVLDSSVRYLEITLYQNGNVIALSNEATATASFVTDDVLIDDSVECTISNNIISVPLEDLQRHGNLDVQVTVTEDTKVLAIPFPIQVRVTPNIAENAQIDENSMGSYAEVVQEIAEARGSYANLKERLDHTGATDEQVAEAVEDYLDEHPIELSSDMIDDTDQTNKFVTIDEKTNWDGKYSKPSGGIPKTDLASAVQTSLGKADTALQSEQYTGTVTGVKMNGSIKGTSGMVDLGTVVTAHQDISGKADKSEIPSKTSQLQNDSDFVSSTEMYNNIDQVLSGDTSIAPFLTIDNIVNATYNPNGDYILYYKDFDGVRHNLFNISQYFAAKSAIPTKTSQLENDSGYISDDVPAYVKSEAERLAAVVRTRQSSDTISFLAISDFHYDSANISGNGAQIRTSNTHALQAIKIVSKKAKLDFICGLGDFTWGTSGTSESDGKAEILEMISELYENAKGAPFFVTTGNHDPLFDSLKLANYLTTAILYPLIEAYSSGEKTSNAGYSYVDFSDKKIRVICLNTADSVPTTGTDNSYIGDVSYEQAQWFANSLDLSGKSSASQWHIIIISHHPLDWDRLIPLVKILKAYENGAAVSFTHNSHLVSYDYSNRNSAKIVAQFHGHTHNFKTDNLHYFDDDGTQDFYNFYPVDGIGSYKETHTLKTVNAQRVAIPNACFLRSNQYGQNSTAEMHGIEFGEETTYNKTANSAEDTAFCVITINKATYTIYADHYGAGYDRVLSYGQSLPYIDINIVPSYVVGKRLKASTGAEADLTGCTSTGFIPITQGDTLYFGGGLWQFNNVTNQTALICLYDSSKNYISDAYMSASEIQTLETYGDLYIAEIVSSNFRNKDISAAAYCRICLVGSSEIVAYLGS